MLFEPDRHEPLLGVKWDAAQACEVIRAIVADFEATLGSGIGWPVHPQEDMDEPDSQQKSLYFGASGTLWAMWHLQQEGAVTLGVTPPELIERVYQAYLSAPDTGEVVPSYYLGEVGILLVHWKMTRSNAVADRLWTVIKGNIPHPANEALWGAPGTMLGAWHMFEWTGEQRWRDLYLENVEHLWQRWLPSENAPCHLWTQDLYGRIVQLIGAGHGFAGNAYPLLRGAALLTAERREKLYERIVETVRATAVVEGDCANWPPSVGAPRPGRTDMLVQWCHGSPGMVTGLGHFPRQRSSDMDEMLIKAGNLVWNAGPLTKGPGLCHGTAGNGYAFLKLHRRTGDPIWLDRARAFAMHAILQQAKMRKEYGGGRYTLWTGDAGVAVYLWHCLNGLDGMPGLDTFD